MNKVKIAKMVRLYGHITKAQKDKIAKMAKVQKVSESTIIRNLIDSLKV